LYEIDNHSGTGEKCGLALYEKYDDKEWGMTDCISITVMKENKLNVSFTTDNHFIQAGFEIVLK
jgi:uncharacterized protein